ESSRGSSGSASCWRRSGAEHRVKALPHCLKVDALLAHTVRKPVMLIEANTFRATLGGTRGENSRPQFGSSAVPRFTHFWIVSRRTAPLIGTSLPSLSQTSVPL